MVATVITKTIGSGGDYATIAAWESATTKDLVAADEIQIGELLSGGHEIDFGDVVISGSTVDVSHYRILKYDSQRYHPYDDTGPRIYAAISTGTAVDEAAIEINEDYFRFQGIGIVAEAEKLLASGTHTGSKYGVHVLSDNVVVSSVFVKMAEGGKVGDGLAMVCFQMTGASICYLANCIAMGSRYPVGAQNGYNWETTCTGGGAYNCVAHNISRSVGIGFLSLVLTSRPDLVNCIATNCQNSSFAGLYNQYHHNISSDSTAGAAITGSANTTPDPDSITYVGASTIFLNGNAQDFRNKITSPGVNSGSDETAAFISVLGFAEDFDGVIRLNDWEIGAYDGVGIAFTNTITTVINSIGPGKDFADISDWLAATELSCYANSTRYVGELYDNGTFYDASSAPYRVRRAISTGRFYRELRAANSNEKYQPRSGIGAQILGSGGGGVGDIMPFDGREDYFRLSGIAITQNNTSAASKRGLMLTGHDCRFDAIMVIYTTSNASTAIAFDVGGYGSLITNSICKGSGISGQGALVGFRVIVDRVSIFNCIADRLTGGPSGNGTGFEESLVSFTKFVNCIGSNCDRDFHHNAGDVAGVTQSNNISTDGTAAGPGSLINQLPLTVMNAAVLNDFRLIPGSPAINAGTNLTPFFSTDFDGNRRFAPFDIGLYEGFADSPLFKAMDPANQKTHRTISCYEIVRLDGFTLYLTDANAPIPHNGQIFEAGASVAASALRSEVSLKETSKEFTGAITSSKITAEDLAAKRYRGATVIERRLDHRFPWTEPIRRHIFTIQDTDYDEDGWRASLGGIGTKLEQRQGESVVHQCGYVLGDPITCKADIESLTQDGVAVSSVIRLRREFDAAAVSIVHVDDTFGYGDFVWLDGDNAGIITRVKSYTQTNRRIVLEDKMPFDIQVTDTFRMAPGCRRDYRKDCIAKFANGTNHGGEGFLPRTDRTLQTPIG